jgi:hypothetical protein
VLSIAGCDYDASPVAPYARAVTPPGAARCDVRIAWTSNVYPAVVDPAWTTTGAMTANRSNHTATLLPSGQVLLTGGRTSVVLSSAELYDPATGTFTVTASMGAARFGHTASALGTSKVLITGGDTGTIGLKSAELYDPTAGTFTATTSTMTAAREGHSASVLLSGKVLLAGGFASNGSGGMFLPTAEIYDPTADTFTATTGPMGTSRENHTASVLSSGKVLIAGGGAGASTSSQAELYDPVAGTFSATGPLQLARANHAAVVLASGSVLVIGGNGVNGPNPYYTSTAEIYNPTAGTFTFTGSMSVPRFIHTATGLPGGKVLVAAGQNGGAGLSSSEVYDPAAGTFALSGSLSTYRESHTATLLTTGKVLVAGGNVLNAELFALVPNGGACTLATECVSGICDVLCCASACGMCRNCDGTGACVKVTSTDDPDSCTGTMTCDANGSCKLKNGQPSSDPTTCASGSISDGVCCDTACAGACDVCTTALGATANGTCTTAPAGYAGNPSCAPLVCNGGVTCPGSCAADTDCAPGTYCAANGTCQPQKALGLACNTAAGADCKAGNCRECASGFCVDAVCCNTSCNSLCSACAAALQHTSGDGGAPTDGLCGAAKYNTNPHKDNCPSDPVGTCGRSGMCDGNGACAAHYPVGTSCAASSCSDSATAVSQACNSSGACAPGTPMDCTPYLCAAGACTTTCANDTDCSPKAFCSPGNKCVPKESASTACTSADQCVTGFCVDGVCCDSKCDGQCQACDAAGHTGTCTTIAGAPHGARQPCDGAHTACAGSCDGAQATQCSYPPTTTSCGSSCADGLLTPNACNGHGKCIGGQSAACPGGLTCADATSCKTSCSVDADCAGGVCASGVCTQPHVTNQNATQNNSGCSASPANSNSGFAYPLAVLALVGGSLARRRRRAARRD